MLKSNFLKMVSVVALLFVAFSPYSFVYANDINPEHKGRIVINTRDTETNNTLNGMTVHLYQVGLLDESYQFIPVDTNIDPSSSADVILGNAKNLNLTKESVISEAGFVSFEGLNLGVYLIEIPDQKLDGVNYGANPFLIEIPIRQDDSYSYLIEATPKISIHNDPNNNPVPLTSSQSSIWMWLLISTGLVFLLYGIATEIHGKKKKH